jgi:hypothetical protein
MDGEAQLTIGEVARQAGNRASRIRYYESVGVLPVPERVSGMRRNSPDAVRSLEGQPQDSACWRMVSIGEA